MKGRLMFRSLKVVVLTVVVLTAAVFALSGCKVRTPEVHGLVLDAGTKEPVVEAWVRATLRVETETIAGSVSPLLAISPPHLRTDKDGRFVIPSKSLKSSMSPLRGIFRTKVLRFRITANTMDDRGGKLDYVGEHEMAFYRKHFGEPDGRAEDLMGRGPVELTLYVEPTGMTVKEYSYDLMLLSGYCSSGRYTAEVPPVEGGCDDWELDYGITRAERLIERIGEPRTSDQRSEYSASLHWLGYFYKGKKDYKKAIETFRRAIEFDKRMKYNLWIGRHGRQIEELERLLKKEQP